MKHVPPRRTAGRPRVARDARLGQRWTAPQKLKNWVFFQLIRGLLALADAAPPRLLVWAGRTLGVLTWRVVPSLVARAERRARAALAPERAARVARDCFRNAGENLALILTLRRPERSALSLVEVSTDASARIRAALAPGKGTVFVSAHLGPFEAIAAVIAELGFSPVVVVRESYDPRLDPLVDRHRSLRGIEIIHRGRPAAARRIMKALAAGRPVGFLPDLPGRTRSATLDFLGARATLPVGPARIALRTGAPVLAGTLVRRCPHRPGGLSAPFALHIEDIRASAEAGPISEEDLHQEMMDALGRAVLRSPEDWLWMS